MRDGPLRCAWTLWMMDYQRRAYSCGTCYCYTPCNGACPDPGCFPLGSMPMLAGLAGQRACKHKSPRHPSCLAHRHSDGLVYRSVIPCFTDVDL